MQEVLFPLTLSNEVRSFWFNEHLQLLIAHLVLLIDQVPPVVRSNLGIGFVPNEMLYGSPEFTGIYPITLEEPITPRSIYLFQRKNQPLSIAAKHLRQMLLAPTEESDS